MVYIPLPSKFFLHKDMYTLTSSFDVRCGHRMCICVRHLQPRGTFLTRKFAAMNVEFLFNGSLFMFTFHMKREVIRNVDDDAAEEYK